MTFDSSPTSVMSYVSTGSSKRPDVNTGIDSLTASSQAPETSTISVTSCLSCSKVFAGSSQDAEFNLQRHLRESRRHNKNAGRKCPQPECVLKTPMRSDNLRQHLQNLHKMSLSEANVVIDEIKASARRVENGGIAQRRSHKAQRDNPLLLGSSYELPQRFSDNLHARSEEASDNPLVHDLLRHKATSSITEDAASKTCSDSRYSEVSRDSGYDSVNAACSREASPDLASTSVAGIRGLTAIPEGTLLDFHPHWCFICDENRARFNTCDSWKKHMRDHETTYPCLPCESQANLSHAKTPTFTRKATLVKHLEIHGISHASVKADKWCRTLNKKYHACGFCICLFETFPDCLDHIDHVHFRSFKTLEDWDENRVILGLLQQPMVRMRGGVS